MFVKTNKGDFAFVLFIVATTFHVWGDTFGCRHHNHTAEDDKEQKTTRRSPHRGRRLLMRGHHFDLDGCILADCNARDLPTSFYDL